MILFQKRILYAKRVISNIKSHIALVPFYMGKGSINIHILQEKKSSIIPYNFEIFERFNKILLKAIVRGEKD